MIQARESTRLRSVGIRIGLALGAALVSFHCAPAGMDGESDPATPATATLPSDKPTPTTPPIPIDVGPGGNNVVSWQIDGSTATPGDPYQIREELKCDLSLLTVLRKDKQSSENANWITFTLRDNHSEIVVRVNKTGGTNSFLVNGVSLAPCWPDGAKLPECSGDGIPSALFNRTIGGIRGELANRTPFDDGISARFTGTSCN